MYWIERYQLSYTVPVLLNENCLLSSTIFRMPHGYSCRWKQVIWLQNLYLFYIWTQTYKYSFNLDFSKKADTCLNWGKIGTLPRLFGNLPRIICHFGKSWYRWPHLNLNQQHNPSMPVCVCSCCICRSPICR